VIEVKCNRCKQSLDSFGALLFGVPDVMGRVSKRHLCFACYDDLIYWMGKGKS